jgi:hypothetical protein
MPVGQRSLRSTDYWDTCPDNPYELNRECSENIAGFLEGTTSLSPSLFPEVTFGKEGFWEERIELHEV